jgi:hypothetical protein
MNKQPFYHRVDGLLFTSTTGFCEDDFVALLKAVAKSSAGKALGLIVSSIEVEPNGYAEPEAGDPCDLM